MDAIERFHVGEQVGLLRDLAGLPVQSEGVVRGVSANADGISYAVRFDQCMRIVAEPDLRPTKRTSP